MKSCKIVLFALPLILAACQSSGSSATGQQASSPWPSTNVDESVNPLNNCVPYIRPKRELLLTANQTGEADRHYKVRLQPEANTAIGIGTSTGDFETMHANLRYEVLLTESAGTFTVRLYQLDSSNNETLLWPLTGTKTPDQDGTFNAGDPSFDPAYLYQGTQAGVRYAQMIVAHRGKLIRLLLWNN